MDNIRVTLNYLGVPVEPNYAAKLHDGADHSGEIEYRMITHVLELRPDQVPIEVIERYIEVSRQETYTPVFPHSHKLFERFLQPLKSAKCCYCLGEYLASIELCAHIGEMLALLIWQITAVTIDEKIIDEPLEKALFGRDFEKLGQEQRIDILQAVEAIPEADARLLDFLRSTRRGYFHFWERPRANIKQDALECFLKISSLVQNTLQIEFVNGQLSMNPLLIAYLEKHPQP